MASTAATPILQGARTCSHCGREQSPSRFVNRRYRHRLTAMCLACRQSCRPGSHAPVGAEPSSSATASSVIVVGRPTPLIASDPTPAHEASSTAALSEIVLGRPAPTQRAPPSASMGRSPQSPAADQPLHASRPLPVLLPRGQDSGDTPSAAEARRRLHATRRRHRLDRRDGQDPSPTPGLSSLVRQLHEEEESSDTLAGRSLSASPRWSLTS